MTAERDEFAGRLLEEAKRFLELAKECSEASGVSAYLHGSLLLSFCALEAFVNSIAEEVTGSGSNMSAHERGLLLEREVRLRAGVFEPTDRLKMSRLEDRIELLHRHFSGKPVDHNAPWWSSLGSAIALRNALTHPKGAPLITDQAVERAVQSVVDALDALFRAVYGRGFPQAGRGVMSRQPF